MMVKRKNKIWTEEEIKNLKVDYINFLDEKIMEEKYKRSFHNIQIKAVTLGIKRGRPERIKRKTDKLDINLVSKLYLEGMSPKNIGKLFNLSSNTILKYLKRENIKIKTSSEFNSKYKYNNNFFDIIDSESKAYFLGLLYADGCNFKDQYIKLSLKSNDIHILESFTKCIKSTRPIVNDKKGLSNMIISSKNISNKLTLLGCPNRKTFILKFPSEQQVPKYLTHHFIRGFFDGDGGISLAGGNNRIYFTTTSEFLDSLVKILQAQLNFKITKYQNKKGNTSNIRSIFYGGRRQVELFGDYIYKDATLYLTRKYNKFILNKSPNI